MNKLSPAAQQNLLSLLTLSCGLGFAIYAAGVYFSFTAGDLPFPEPERLVAIEASRDGERSQAKRALLETPLTPNPPI